MPSSFPGRRRSTSFTAPVFRLVGIVPSGRILAEIDAIHDTELVTTDRLEMSVLIARLAYFDQSDTHPFTPPVGVKVSR